MTTSAPIRQQSEPFPFLVFEPSWVPLSSAGWGKGGNGKSPNSSQYCHMPANKHTNICNRHKWIWKVDELRERERKSGGEGDGWKQIERGRLHTRSELQKKNDERRAPLQRLAHAMQQDDDQRNDRSYITATRGQNNDWIHLVDIIMRATTTSAWTPAKF